MSVTYIQELVAIPSPSGYTGDVVRHIQERLKHLPYRIKVSNKGALLVSLTVHPQLLITAHIDTLGGMVKHLREDGTLEITQIGGWPPNSFEGEYVTILTQSGKTYRGTFLINNPAAHVNREIPKIERQMDKMHIRIDAITRDKKETGKLGVNPGDYVFFDPRFEHTSTGYIKSRFLDDKACAGILYDILLNHYETIRHYDVGFFFSNYEEVGHGVTAALHGAAQEMLVADMGVVGENVAGTETAVSICAKDSTGPYDYDIRRKLAGLAKQHKLPYVVDVFPYYGSDGSAALHAGLDLRVGLIGPGVNSSHGVERTHQRGIDATRKLILHYIQSSEYRLPK